MHRSADQRIKSPMLRTVRGCGMRHPTLGECRAAGRGPENFPGKPFEVGGLPDTPEERARFEAYMGGHCWEVGKYHAAKRAYDTNFVRCCYGVWRDRGSLPTVAPNPAPGEEGA